MMGRRTLLLLVLVSYIKISQAHVIDFESGTLEDNNLHSPCNGMSKWKIVNVLPEGVPNPGGSKGFITPESPTYSCVDTITPFKLSKGKNSFRTRMYLTRNQTGDSRVAITIYSPESRPTVFLYENTENEWLDKTEEFDIVNEGEYSVQFMGFCSDAWLFIDEFEIKDQETTTTSTESDQPTDQSTEPSKDQSTDYIIDFESGTLEDSNLHTPCNGMGKWKIVKGLPEGVPNPGGSKGFITPESTKYCCVDTITPFKLSKGKNLFRTRMYLTRNQTGDSRVAITIYSPESRPTVFLYENIENEWLDKTEEFDIVDEGEYTVQFMGYCSNAWLYIDEFEIAHQETTTSSMVTYTDESLTEH